jgi:hypothetical protein
MATKGDSSEAACGLRSDRNAVAEVKWEISIADGSGGPEMKKLIAVVLGMAMLCIAILVIRSAAPKSVAANVLIEKAGRYRSPDGSFLVDMKEEDGGKLSFVFYRQDGEGQRGAGPTNPFRADSDWLMCWDSQGRLWTYVPEQDGKYCRYWYANEESTGSCGVGELGGWQGIPEAFFARLPDAVKKTYEAYGEVT